MFEIKYTKKAADDIPKIKAAKLSEKVKLLLDLLRIDPFKIPPRFEKLCGDLNGAFSRRINIKHRLVYQVYKREKIVKIISLWTHYDL